jgi:hypothetical protein
MYTGKNEEDTHLAEPVVIIDPYLPFVSSVKLDICRHAARLALKTGMI